MLVLPPGTRIVTRDLVVIPETGQTQPAGAVAVIVRSPAEGALPYRVRFPDASEANLKREEMTFFKDRGEVGAPPDDVDWNAFVIYRCVAGSRAFGLDVEGSDTDRRGIYLPPAELHWSLHGVPEQLENEATQETYWELGKFVRLALKADPNILECLHSPLVEDANDLARELLAMREAFLSKLVYQTYNGYVLSQFRKLEQDLRTRGAIKWKHAMHLVRLLIEGIAVVRDHVVPVRVTEHRDVLLAIRAGRTPWSEINELRLELHRRFDEAFRATTLPDRPDFARVDAFVVRARRRMVTS